MYLKQNFFYLLYNTQCSIVRQKQTGGINWISSEAKWDYLSSAVSGTVEGASINTKGSNYTQEEAQVGEFMLQQGATLSFTYRKDGSGNNGDDTAYLILEINGVVVTAYVPAE